jgi:hypothetical protein
MKLSFSSVEIANIDSWKLRASFVGRPHGSWALNLKTPGSDEYVVNTSRASRRL